MATQEIPREQWPEFLDSFSRQHAGWLVTLEVLDAEIGAQVEAQELALVGISLDEKGSDKESIVIDVSADVQTHAAHRVLHPTHIHLKTNDEGAHEALAIESAEGTTTLVRFRATALPEMVDGIAS